MLDNDVQQPEHGSTSAGHPSAFLDSFQHPNPSSCSSHLSSEGSMSDATANGQDWHPSVFAPPASLLNSRRPSFTASLPEPVVDWSHVSHPSRTDMAEVQPAEFSPSSPEDGGNFRRSLQIDMKGLVGDAVGNMSISPASRDVVLAARRGLFIIDLEAPWEVPRFFPQGGTWDVADVQWNPHPSRAEYIVSTSSEKLLIWNILMVGKTSIEHILQAHYRAITDINWHTTECDTVASTGIDSWIWAWDLREPRKPIFGISPFKTGGTQVKWNRKDGNIFASSHSEEVFIWDRRKGSLPVCRIKAHNSKIYGIDWSHDVRNEIVTCSLDKTIKVWDLDTASAADTEIMCEPKTIMRTTYPVWRARNLPFGRGVLSLAQRGMTTLEMYAQSKPQEPAEIFEGHTDVVKEFVWRKGGSDDFQLITWSKDRTLRFWPVDLETMQKVGHSSRGCSRTRHKESSMSFRNPPKGSGYPPVLSAPVGHRAILAEVRASLPPMHHLAPQALDDNTPPVASSTSLSNGTVTKPAISLNANARSQAQGGTMSRGNNGGKSVARMDAFTWLSNVKVGGRKESSSGPGSVAGSAGPSRVGSGSRARSDSSRMERSAEGGRSESRSRVGVGEEGGGASVRRESDAGQSLQDEITSVLTKLASYKIKLEKHDLTKKRTCTLGLHGPWGGSSSVFIRVTFTFPRDYPQATYPDGIPIVELERNPQISMKDRAFMLRHLRIIRNQKRPCLEACLRFLLSGGDGEGATTRELDMGDSDSSEDDGNISTAKKGRDVTVALLRNNKNLVEPRTSQGTFGPSGELVCFFRDPPRIVRNVIRGLTDSPATPFEDPPNPISTTTATSINGSTEAIPRMFQSPSLISDAVRRLALSATDRLPKSYDPRKREARDENNILRIMTNLLTFSQQRGIHRDSDAKPLPVGDILKSYALLAGPRRSTVFLTQTTNLAGADRKVAEEYVFSSRDGGLGKVCEVNAAIARKYGRRDHERVFETLRPLLPTKEQIEDPQWAFDSLPVKVIKRLYSDFSNAKDIQMLAILSILLLQTGLKYPEETLMTKQSEVRQDTQKLVGVDYFTITKEQTARPSPPSAWPHHHPSPVPPPVAASLSSSGSSGGRASWSSLFNTGSVRQFMSGVQDTLKEGLTTPLEISSFVSSDVPVISHKEKDRDRDKASRLMDSPGTQRKRRPRTHDPAMYSPTPSTSTSRSSNESLPPGWPVKSTSPGQRRLPLSQVTDSGNVDGTVRRKAKIAVFEIPAPLERPAQEFSDLIEQFVTHVRVYGDLLYRWGLHHKRLEKSKPIGQHIARRYGTQGHDIGLALTCTRCSMILPVKVAACPSCGNPCSMASCTICRLPVKGLSRSCLRCFHVTHVSCWKALDVPICPTGCGCLCNGMDETQSQSHTTRFGRPQSPPAGEASNWALTFP